MRCPRIYCGLGGWFIRFTFVSALYHPTLLCRHGQADSPDCTASSSGIATREHERCILGMSSLRLQVFLGSAWLAQTTLTAESNPVDGALKGSKVDRHMHQCRREQEERFFAAVEWEE
jgi:hypothetical protein